MSTYSEEEYTIILTSAIRADVVVPFDCYLYLAANDRIVRFVAAGHAFPKERIEKLKSFRVAQLHIKKEDEPAYFEYLRSFFKTEEGAQIYKQIQEEQKAGAVVGVPEAFKMEPVDATSDQPTETTNVAGADVIEDTTTISGTTENIADQTKVTGSNDGTDDTTTVSGDGKDLQDTTETKVEGVTENKTDDVIEILRSNIDALDDTLKFKAELEQDESNIIKNATDHIEEEISRVEGFADHPDSSETSIGSVTQKILEEVLKVGGVVQKHGSAKGLRVKSMVDDLEKDVKNLQAAPNKKEKLAKIKTKVWQLKRLASENEKGLVAGNVNDMVSVLEHALGGKLVLSSTISKEGDEEVAKQLDEAAYQAKQFKEKIQRALPNDPDLIKNFDQILKQINSAKTGHALTGVQSKSDSGAVIVDENGERTGASVTVTGSDQNSPQEQNPTQVKRQLSEQEQDELEEARAENNVLKVQLQDAKALISTNGKKIDDLEQLLKQNTDYIRAMEAELAENKKTIFQLTDQVQKLEFEKSQRESGDVDTERAATQNKAEMQARDENIRTLRDQIIYLERDLKIFTDTIKKMGIDPEELKNNPRKLPLPPEFVAALAEREQAISLKAKELDLKVDEIKELKRENAKLNSHLQGINTIKKQMSSKFDKLTMERETIMKSQDALNRKVTILTNLSEKERQTISKLTAITEELRRDRVEYMNKTNAALRSHKDVANKTQNLSNQIETAQNANKQLQEQNDSLKQKQSALVVELGASNKQVKTLEADIKKLQKVVNDLRGESGGGSVRALENKIATLEKDKKTMESQLKAEQRRSDAAVQELRQYKLGKAKPATKKTA